MYEGHRTLTANGVHLLVGYYMQNALKNLTVLPVLGLGQYRDVGQWLGFYS